jgi:NADH:ubiquinone oxidoreductase subunit 6 (subunit J)
MTLCFIILFPLIIINSLLVILSKNSVTSVLYLISVFILVSINLIYIGAEFLAILIIIIYIGAISILFLFVIMMLNLRILEVYSSLINIFPIGSFLGIFLFLELFYIVKKEYFLLNYIYNNYLELNVMNNYLILSHNNLYLIGDLLFNHYNLLLIIVGLILLLAMVGAIILTKDISKSMPIKKYNILTKSSITF